MHELLFITVEDAEHRCTGAFEQFPEAAVQRVFVTLDPASVLQYSKKFRDLLGLGEPLVDGLAIQAAVVGMHVLTERPLALKHRDHFLLQVERLDHLS